MQPTKRAQLAIFFTVFVDLLGFGIVIPILPLYAKGLAQHPSGWMAWVNQLLGLSDPGAFWAGTALVAFSASQFIATPILGRISDLVGRRPVLSGSHFGTALLAGHGWHLPFFVASGLSLFASMLVLIWLPETLTPEARLHARTVESRGHALKRALKRPGMPQILLIALLAMVGFAMMEGTYSLLANKRFGLGQREVGYLFGFVGILIVLYQGGLVRVVAKRVPERVALLAGLALMACCLPMIPYAPWKWPFMLVMVPLAWGSGMNTTATSALASRITPSDEQGGLFGVLNAMSGIGRIVGPLLGTFTFARFGFASSYWVASGAVALAILLAVTLPRTQPIEDPAA